MKNTCNESYPGSHGRMRLAKSNGVLLPVKCKAAAIDMIIHRLCKCAGYAPFRMLFCNLIKKGKFRIFWSLKKIAQFH